MAGYRGYSMSNNAYEAYLDDEKPKSKWTKADILAVLRKEGVSPAQIEVVRKIPSATLKEIGLYESSWHHTSSHYNRTSFYSVDVGFLERVKPGVFDEKPKKKAPEPQERWIAEFLVWSGTRNHPHAKEVTSEGILKGNWFYLPDGTKKSTTARGFRLIRRLRDVFPFDLPHIPQGIPLRPYNRCQGVHRQDLRTHSQVHQPHPRLRRQGDGWIRMEGLRQDLVAVQRGPRQEDREP